MRLSTSEKPSLIMRFFFFILFAIGIIFLVLLIRYDWNFNKVVEYILGFLR